MNRKQYEAMRRKLMDEAQGLLDAGKVDEANAKMPSPRQRRTLRRSTAPRRRRTRWGTWTKPLEGRTVPVMMTRR